MGEDSRTLVKKFLEQWFIEAEPRIDCSSIVDTATESRDHDDYRIWVEKDQVYVEPWEGSSVFLELHIVFEVGFEADGEIADVIIDDYKKIEMNWGAYQFSFKGDKDIEALLLTSIDTL